MEKTQTVKSSTLEKTEVPKYKNALLKIDTQGYEYPILLGSKKFLKHITINT